jgi:hypothetical protein
MASKSHWQMQLGFGATAPRTKRDSIALINQRNESSNSVSSAGPTVRSMMLIASTNVWLQHVM